MNEHSADCDAACTCPPPWGNDHSPSPLCPEHGQRCHHCGARPDADGDHSCPCPLSDSECLEHTLNPVIASAEGDV